MGLKISSPAAAKASRLDNVQLLRAVAASLVVLGHVQGHAAAAAAQAGATFTRFMPIAGGAGVDLFFVISGFIMVYASEPLFAKPGGAATFLTRRVSRIVPLYWAATTLYLAINFMSARHGGHLLPSSQAIAASYAFLPYDTTGRGDGFAFPLLDLGWTLNYELFFYLVFAAFIRFGRSLCTTLTVAALAIGVALGAALKPTSIALIFWTRPIVLEFAMGMALALLFRSGARVNRLGQGLLVVAGLVGLLLNAPGQGALPGATTPNDFLRVFGWGLPCALILTGSVLGPDREAPILTRMGLNLGDASYALYLIHAFVLIAAEHLWAASGLAPEFGYWPFVVATCSAAMGAAVLTYQRFERPLTRALRHLETRATLRVPVGANPPG